MNHQCPAGCNTSAFLYVLRIHKRPVGVRIMSDSSPTVPDLEHEWQCLRRITRCCYSLAVQELTQWTLANPAAYNHLPFVDGYGQPTPEMTNPFM
jgi:hypothetical protein